MVKWRKTESEIDRRIAELDSLRKNDDRVIRFLQSKREELEQESARLREENDAIKASYETMLVHATEQYKVLREVLKEMIRLDNEIAATPCISEEMRLEEQVAAVYSKAAKLLEVGDE